MSIIFATTCWFSSRTIVSSTNKTDCRNITLSLIVLIITLNSNIFRWLLRDPEMKVRSNYEPYQKAVERFFSQLIPQVADLQVYLNHPMYMDLYFIFQITDSINTLIKTTVY